MHLPLLSEYNGKAFGKPNAGEDMTFDFGQLVAHAAKTRHLGAGAIIGSGTVSNKQELTTEPLLKRVVLATAVLPKCV